MGNKTFDPPSIAAGANTTTTVTVVGATIGKFATATFSLSLDGLKPLTAYVSSTDTVTVLFENPTASSIDLASGTLYVRVS